MYPAVPIFGGRRRRVTWPAYYKLLPGMAVMRPAHLRSFWGKTTSSGVVFWTSPMYPKLAKPLIISSHAEYRHSDYAFERTQSRAQSALDWEHRGERLHSWSEMLFPALSMLAVAAAAVEILH